MLNKQTVILYGLVGLLIVGGAAFAIDSIKNQIEIAQLAKANETLLTENQFIKGQTVSLEEGLTELRKSNEQLANDFARLTKDVKGIKPVAIIQGGGQANDVATITDPTDDDPVLPGQQIKINVKTATSLVQAQNINGDLYAKGETTTEVLDSDTNEVLFKTTIPWTDRMTNVFQIEPIKTIDKSPKNQLQIGYGFGSNGEDGYLLGYTRKLNTEGRYKLINWVTPDGVGLTVVKVPGETYAFITGTWGF